MNQRQLQLLEAMKAAGCTSPVTRQDIVDACTASGAYACPPSWLTQDSARKCGRGLYDCPELASMTETAPAVAVAVESAPAPAPVVGSVESVQSVATANLAMGMTGGERATLIPDRFNGYVAWGHFSDVEQIVRSKQFYPIFVTGLSGNGKTLMVEQCCAKLKRECYRVNITRQTDEDDLLGGFRLVNGNTVWQDGPVVCAMKNGGVLLLDEIDLGSANLMCLQPVLEGKGVFLKKINQWVKPATGFTVFATANTKGKGSDDGRFVGTGVMNEAMLDRFPITLEQPYATRATERKILTKAGCDDSDFADHLTKWAEIIRKSFYEGAVDEIISTRRLVDIVKAQGIFNDKTKAINFCLSRFDDDTKEAFLSLYSKVDADMNPNQAESTDAASVGNECPF
jgi:hypothetical protein|tara:strand:- start:4728 stop:5921 length:1194 start_codon:yes stop_codon:yes gene_type:complete